MKKFVDTSTPDLDNNDLLNSKSYAVALEEAINNQSNIVIGLFGSWGSGKSTIIEYSKKLVAKKKKNVKFITYNAWKYIGDSFSRTFLLALAKGLRYKNIDELRQKFYSDISVENKVKFKVNWLLLGLSLVMIILGCVIYHINLEYSWFNDLKKGVKDSLTLAGFFTLFLNIIIPNLFINLTTSQQIPLLFSDEQFTEHFNKIVQKQEKVVIIIDDLDRCDATIVYDVLSKIKIFIENKSNIIFIIPIDHRAVYKHLQMIFNYEDQESAEFLRKLFDVHINIKPLAEVELFDFANNFNKKHALNFSSDAIGVIANEYAKNPRRIIQFFHNALLELDVLKHTGIAPEQLNLLCKLLIIRDEWPIFYEKICDHHELLIMHPKNIPDAFKIDEINALKTFLHKTYVFTKNSEVSLLEKIISNNTIFNDIPTDIRKAVKDMDINKLNTFTGDEKQKELLLTYIDRELAQAINRGQQALAVPNLCKIIFAINKESPISSEKNTLFEQKISDHLAHFFPKIIDDENLIEYLNTLMEVNSKYFIEWIMSNYLSILLELENDQNKRERKEALELYTKLITNLKNNEILSMPRYQNIFLHWYANTTMSLSNISHFEKFVSDKLISQTITEYNSEFVFLLDKEKIEQKHIDAYFAEINKKYPTYQMNESLTGMKDVLEVLKNLPKNLKPNGLEAYATHLLEERRKASSNYYNNTITYTPFIEEINKAPDNLQLFVEFLAYLYKYFPKQSIDNIKKIPNNNPEYFLSLLEYLRVTNDLHLLIDLVFINNLSDIYLYWIKQLANEKNEEGKCIVPETKLKETVQLLFEEIINERTTEETKHQLDNTLYHLLRENKTLYNSIKIDDTLTEPQLQKLSEKVQVLFLDHISNNLEKFPKSVLMVAKYGNEKQINEHLISYIQKHVDEDPRNIIKICEEIPQTLLSSDNKKVIKALMNKYKDSV